MAIKQSLFKIKGGGGTRNELSIEHLLSAIGILNVVCRLTVGFVVDKKVASSLIICALGPIHK